MRCKLEKEVDNLRDALAELTAHTTQKIRQLENRLDQICTQGSEVQKQIIRSIRSEVRFIEERFGLITEFRIDTMFGDVSAYVCSEHDGRIIREGTVSLSHNPYYDMLLALSAAIKMDVGQRYDNVKIPTLTDYTAEQLSREVGCDVKIVK